MFSSTSQISRQTLVLKTRVQTWASLNYLMVLCSIILHLFLDRIVSANSTILSFNIKQIGMINLFEWQVFYEPNWSLSWQSSGLGSRMHLDIVQTKIHKHSKLAMRVPLTLWFKRILFPIILPWDVDIKIRQKIPSFFFFWETKISSLAGQI